MLLHFRTNVIVRVGILLGLITGLAFSLADSNWLVAGFIALFTAIAVGNLIFFVNQTNRDLANFFASVRYNDFTTTGSAGHKGEHFGELHQGFNLVNRKFQEIRAEKEANHQFLQTIVEHINIGLLCVNNNEEVILMNKALQRLLHKSYLVNLEGLKAVDSGLGQVIGAMKPGDRELVKLNVDNKLLQLAIQYEEIKLHRELIRLFSFQNIQGELEAQELEAWQKLIRILTHEIMNSVAPIASLSSTLREIVNGHGELDEGALGMVRNSLGVIQKRSEGLLDFTETYRSLTRVPPPKFQLIEGKALLQEAHTLFLPEMKEKKIEFNLHLPPAEANFQGDPNLLEQVLINLIKNAKDAVKEQDIPRIDLHLQKQDTGKVLIMVADNGVGIPPEAMEQIFVPFYTTKKEGSGIGLSLSRQILRLHKGTIEARSEEGKGTVFTIAI